MTAHQSLEQSYLLNAGSLGWIEGVTLCKDKPAHDSVTPVLHYFGGLPYALPPVGQFRFRQARPLPEGFRFGTKANPGRYTRKTAVCPQPGSRSPPDETWWDEDCLQLNVFVPAGPPPRSGWPVFFYIHGGFLQAGTANMSAAALIPLLSETAFKAIIVAPAYRLNSLGFLASRELQDEAKQFGEPVGNQGFWDQRLALEFVSQNIAAFGGDPDNITVGGYSAGAYSAYQQLAHELYFVPADRAVIKRVIMWSQGPGVQPKVLSEHQKQFDELLSALDIPATLSPAAKLSRLRAVPSQSLIAAQDKMTLTEFRALSDGVFISHSIISHINTGDFGRRMKARGIKLMNGECRDEHFVYRIWRTPSPSYKAVSRRLCADYPEAAVRKLLHHYTGDLSALPQGMTDWQDAFGRFYANMQIHCLERGFLAGLHRGGLVPGKDIFRYRFDWRASCADNLAPAHWGVTHGTDLAIWFWGLGIGDGLTESEKQLLRPWNESFASFVHGNEVKWETHTIRDMFRLRSDGESDVWVDDAWSDGLSLWQAVNGHAGRDMLAWLRSKL